MRSIGKIVGVSTVAVLKWVRAAGAKIQEKPFSAPAHVIVDEMWHFVNGKKTKFGSGEPFAGFRVELWHEDWVIVLINR